MRIIKMLSFCGVIAVFMFGCGGSKPPAMTNAGNVPDWYTNTRSDANYFYAANTAVSQDLQLAFDKASTGARAEIARQAGVRISALQKRFDEEVGIENDAQLLQMFNQAAKTVVASTLQGTKIAKKQQVKDGNNWRAYVLVEYPIAATNAALLEQIINDQRMYTRFRASEAFKELEDEVKKFEAWKESSQKK
jgi:hypothetical protein